MSILSVFIGVLCVFFSTVFLQLRALESYQILQNSFDSLIEEDDSMLSPSPSSAISPYSSASASPLAPALFILGDSTVDCGNNNYLGTFARADRFPYGRDFDTHRPTGRFCNGRIPVDYLALRLGLPFVPAFLGQSGAVEDMIHGVNYASAGAGIILSSGSELGQHISLTQQIQQARGTFQQFILNLGEEEANDLISKSVFYLSIGANDFIQESDKEAQAVAQMEIEIK